MSPPLDRAQPDTCFSDYTMADEREDEQKRIQQAENEADTEALVFLEWLIDEAGEDKTLAVTKCALRLWACGGIHERMAQSNASTDMARVSLSAVCQQLRERWIEVRVSQLEML